jgi:Glycosyl hydrolase family 12
MIRPIKLMGLAAAASFALTAACSSQTGTGIDKNHDNLADDLGSLVDANHDGVADTIDINNDGIPDGPEVIFKGMKCLALDTDCDGIYDSLDCTGDGVADYVTGLEVPKKNVPGCDPNPLTRDRGTGGGGSGGGSGTAGSGNIAGSGNTAGSGSAVSGTLGNGDYQGAGDTTDRYAESDVLRNNVNYKFIANGWGMNWQSHDIAWNGTSFTVKSLNGTQGSDYSPAGYPSMFCGLYSMTQSLQCGLPAAISSLVKVNTGWAWKSNGNNGQYNAAWDIWLGTGTNLSAYLMVWLRDPPGQQPAGSATLGNVTVQGLPGSWTIWTGNVNGHPIVNYVAKEGSDIPELEFNVLDVYHDAISRGYSLPGDHLLAVATGYEVWNGPIANLQTTDFYVDVQ